MKKILALLLALAMTFTVIALPMKPVLAAPPIAISTVVLPDSYVNGPYNFALAATGGSGSYSWSKTVGSLPTGLALSSAGVISDIPTAAGTYNFTAQVTDTANNTATQNYTIKIKGSGNVYDWGLNGTGQLGNNSTTDITNGATQLSGMTGVVDVSAGGFFTMVLKADGTVWTFGDNSNGQLGNNTTTGSNVPVQVQGPLGVGYLSNVIDIAASDHLALALKSDGTVWDWGVNAVNNLGSLGDGTYIDSSVPVQVKDPSGTGYLTGIVAIASRGNCFSLALKSDGTVYAWGYGGDGELGNNNTANSNLPVQVLGPGGTGFLTNIIAVTTGYDHCLALKSDGTVWAWGADQSYLGDLGNGTGTSSSVPVQVKDPTGNSYLTGIIAIAAGQGYSLALKSDGTIWSWGENVFGLLGTGSTTPGYSYLPVQAASLSGVFTDISASWRHSLALKSDGTVWAWGDNLNGGLGVPSGNTSATATAIQVPGISGAIRISAGYNDSAAIAPPLSSDATLKSLTISSGTLTPNFASGTTSYTDNVAFGVSSVTVSPTVNQVNATVTVNGTPVISGSASGAINLSVGSNTITTVVTAQDGSTKGTYTINVIRAAATVTGKIVFFSRMSDGAYEIFIMNADGSNRTQLTYDDDQDGAPCLSPDGTKIVYTKWVGQQKEIWVMNSDGSGQTVLDPQSSSGAAGDDNPSWSPDGTKVVFQSDRSVWNLIYIINADGTGLTQLNNQPTGSDNIYPSFSPDGTKIIFESGNGITLNSINLNGSNLTPIFTNTAQMLHAKWAPDNSKIVFEVDTGTAPYITVYTINTDGSGKTNIATGAEPAWSPDGKYIVYFYSTGGIAIMTPSGLLVNKLTTNSYDNDPNWGVGSVGISSAAEITAYTLPGQTGLTVINSSAGTIGVTMPTGTNVTALVGTFTTSANITSIKVGSTSQVSGTTANNFTSPVTYVVTAQDGTTTKNWVVTVTLASNVAEITAYSVPGQTGSAVINSSAGTIGVTVPNGTSVTALIATFTTSANITSIKVGSTSQVSGTTANNFTSPVTYVVTAQNGVTTKNWVVTVTVAASNAAEITAYNVPGETGSANINSGAGTIGVTVPTGTNVTALVATFTTSANIASVKVGSTSQVSGTTANNFTSPVTYVVTAQDGITTKNWVVTVTVAASSAAEITAYSVPGQTGSANINSSAGTIGVTVPYGTNVTALVATFTTSANITSIKVGSTGQVSGTTANNFTSPATYVVTAQDGVTAKNWVITVTVTPASNAAEITAYSVPAQIGSAVINSSTGKISVTVTTGTNVTTLVASFTTSANISSIKVASTTQVSGTTANNFTSPVTYVVTAQDGTTTKNWVVTVTVAALSSDTTLSNLTISQGTLTPAFAAGTAVYTDGVNYTVTSVTVTPTINTAGGSITVVGVPVASGSSSGPINLKVGANTITVVITAQDGVTSGFYTITVTRAAPSSDATLSNLTISQGALTPAFASGTTGYADNVFNSVSSVTVTPTVNQANATVTVNGTTVNSGSASGAIALAIGPNTITLLVTAQDGTTTKGYTVTVTRAAPPSSDATLSNLIVSQGTLMPAFVPATTAYSDSVGNAVNSVTVTPTVNQANATMTVNGVAISSGMASGAISLNVGVNTITAVVTAQDGTTIDTYTVTVTRAAAITTTTTTTTALTTSTTTTAVMTTNTAVTTPTITSVTPSTTSTQSSPGATAAVIVPSVLGGLVIVGMGIFFLLRRRKEKIIFTTKPQTIKAGSVSQAITIQIQDAKGNAVKATLDTVIALTSSTGGVFAANSDGTAVITSVTIKANTNSASFYYKDVTKGSVVITVSSSVVATGRQTETIN